MLKPFHGLALVSLGIAAACASIPETGDPAVLVTAVAETKPVGTANDDAADDPAIWRNPVDPSKSLIVGTDKKAGLHVYDLSGRELAFSEGGLLNNVDLVDLGGGRILAAASDRTDPANAHIQLAMLDPAVGALTRLDRIAVGPGEGYGICLGEPSADGTIPIYSAPKNGVIYRTQIMTARGGYAGKTETLTTVPSQPEGCVVDTRTGTLYVGEEAAGIWAIDTGTGEKELVARVDGALLVADVEGLALAAEGEEGGYLVASSQGDNAFAVFRLPGMEPVGRFRIGAGEFGSAEETDGIELDPRSFGPAFPGGLFVAQDGVNEGRAQNFKMVRWDAVIEALGEASAAP